MRQTLLVAGLALGLTAFPGVAAAATPGAATTPIEHAVFVMQEGHSFDNFFGTYPGVDGIPGGVCVPAVPGSVAAACVAPRWVGDTTVPQLDQSSAAFATQFDGGKMDGFVSGQAALGEAASLAMGYYDDRDVPLGWNVADEYVLYDRFFSSAAAGSAPNHMYWVTGASGSADGSIPVDGYGDLPTIFDRLEAAGVSWKFYVQNYNPSITFRTGGGGEGGTQVERVPLLAFPRYLDDPKLHGGIVDLSEYYTDLRDGSLPAVSYIVPAGGGAHTTPGIRAEQQFAGSLIGALIRSSAWPSSMLLWTYASWGGWYDHVAPPQSTAGGLGFRVPALLVSPYARRGYVDRTQLDHTAIPRFITDNWSLQPLGSAGGAPGSLAGGLDFQNPGRPAVFVPITRTDTSVRREPNRAIIFLAYGAALGLAIGLIAIAALRSRGLPGRGHARKAPWSR
ncbi:MAG: alkaline phosphatase family protein [Candidatus Limnocylindrales bacterium]